MSLFLCDSHTSHDILSNNRMPLYVFPLAVNYPTVTLPREMYELMSISKISECRYKWIIYRNIWLSMVSMSFLCFLVNFRDQNITICVCISRPRSLIPSFCLMYCYYERLIFDIFELWKNELHCFMISHKHCCWHDSWHQSPHTADKIFKI